MTRTRFYNYTSATNEVSVTELGDEEQESCPSISRSVWLPVRPSVLWVSSRLQLHADDEPCHHLSRPGHRLLTLDTQQFSSVSKRSSLVFLLYAIISVWLSNAKFMLHGVPAVECKLSPIVSLRTSLFRHCDTLGKKTADAVKKLVVTVVGKCILAKLFNYVFVVMLKCCVTCTTVDNVAFQKKIYCSINSACWRETHRQSTEATCGLGWCYQCAPSNGRAQGNLKNKPKSQATVCELCIPS